MAKTKISEFDIDPANNTDINSINIAEGCAPSGINNAIRQLMSDLKEFQTGAGGDSITATGVYSDTIGEKTSAAGVTVDGVLIKDNAVTASGGFSGALNGAVGGTTPAAGAFTTLSASGAFSANGGVTLGDASGDALTINSSAVSIPNGLNFDSNTFVIDATNNRVGVGTASPATPLHVSGGALTLVAAGPSQGLVRFGTTDTTHYIAGGADYTGMEIGVSGGGDTIKFITGSTPATRMTIAASGYVGINVTPSYQFDVNGTIRLKTGATGTPVIVETGGTSQGTLRFGSGGTEYSINGGADYLGIIFNTAGSERMRITSTGNVGIGTSSPVDNGAGYQTLTLNGSTSGVLEVLNNGTKRGQIYSDGSNIIYNSGTSTGHRWNTAGTDRMRLDTSGNLGLGVTPSAWGSGSAIQMAGGQGYSRYGVTNNAYYDGANYRYISTAAATLYGNNAGSHLWFNAASGTAGNAITFTQAMTLDASGNLGIGTTSPSSRLQISATSSDLVSAFGNVSIFSNDSQAADKGGSIGFGGVYQSSDIAQWSGIRGAKENGTSGNYAGYLSFFTRANGGSTTERMRIDSSGNLLVGTTSASGRLTVKGTTTDSSANMVEFQNSSGSAGFNVRNDGVIGTGNLANSPYNLTTGSAANMYVASGGVVYRSTSSLKYKKDVKNATHGLAEVLKLRPVTYKGKTDGNTVFGGLIAEEVHEAGLIEFVQYAEDGTPDALAYGNMVALAFKAIQELKAEVDSLKAQLNK